MPADPEGGRAPAFVPHSVNNLSFMNNSIGPAEVQITTTYQGTPSITVSNSLLVGCKYGRKSSQEATTLHPGVRPRLDYGKLHLIGPRINLLQYDIKCSELARTSRHYFCCCLIRCELKLDLAGNFSFF